MDDSSCFLPFLVSGVAGCERTGCGTGHSALLFVNYVCRSLYQCCAALGCSRQGVKQNLRRKDKDLIQQDFFKGPGRKCRTVYRVKWAKAWPCRSNPPGLGEFAAYDDSYRYELCCYCVRHGLTSHESMRAVMSLSVTLADMCESQFFFTRNTTGTKKKPPCCKRRRWRQPEPFSGGPMPGAMLVCRLFALVRTIARDMPPPGKRRRHAGLKKSKDCFRIRETGRRPYLRKKRYIDCRAAKMEAPPEGGAWKGISRTVCCSEAKSTTEVGIVAGCLGSLDRFLAHFIARLC